MGYARKYQVSLKETPYYHCVARCVRRAWLCGYDEYAGKDYSHRKHWVIDRLRELSHLFAIEVCAYAVMSNHYHTVLYVDQDRVNAYFTPSRSPISRDAGRSFHTMSVGDFTACRSLSLTKLA